MGRSFIKSRNYRNTKRRDATNPEFYAEGVLYGLTFSNTAQDTIDFDRPIKYNPDIILIEENTKAVFNFSGCDDSLEKTYINTVINGISVGDGFTLTNAQHIDSNSGEISDLSGGFTCGATYDNVIVANVSSITKTQNYNKTYHADGFVGDIVTDFTGLTKTNSTEKNVVTNLFGRNISPSFEKLGLVIYDYVRFDSGSNSGNLLQVVGYQIDKNDHEILTFGACADFVDESRFNQETSVRLYRVESGITASDNLTVNGKVVVLTPTSLSVNAQNFSYGGVFQFGGYHQPTLELQVGSTYVFNVESDILFANDLEFKISSTKDGKWNGGVENPDTKRCGDVLVWYPEFPGTYYYYSEKKPNSGGMIIVSDTSPELQDPVYNSPVNAQARTFIVTDQKNVQYY